MTAEAKRCPSAAVAPGLSIGEQLARLDYRQPLIEPHTSSMDEMAVSSRTPQGQPASCPVCLATVIVQPGMFIGDATCPRCGRLLWFIQTVDATRLFDAERSQGHKNRMLEIIAMQLGVDRDRITNNPALFDETSADSLDIVEIVTELEEEFGSP